MMDVVSLHCESEVCLRAALDQHKRIRRGTLENLERTSSKPFSPSRILNKNAKISRDI